MSDQTGELIKRVKNKDFQALAKLLTVMERFGPSCLSAHAELILPSKQAFRVGITGPPGAGKSTLIGKLISELRARGHTVGIIAVDPSSPFSKGAVLGDRIRYSEHFNDPGVFIRSLGSRGSLGGLSAASYLFVRAFDLAGFDMVLIETVGVGQTELEIINVADFVCVTLVPESGDSIQGMKAGLLEIADLFVVNKADRPGAESFKRELESAIHLGASHGEKPSVEVCSTTATTGDGVRELVDRFFAAKSSRDWQTQRNSSERLRAEAKALLREKAEREIEVKTNALNSPQEFMALFSE